MGYDSNQMRLMGGVPGQQLFLYRTQDDAAAARTAGYFDQAVEHYNLASGDIVLCVSGFGTVPALSALVADVSAGAASMTPLA